MDLTARTYTEVQRLRVLREEMVLAIRKAFSSSVIPWAEVTVHQTKGFGIIVDRNKERYFYVRPDVVTSSIKITACSFNEEYEEFMEYNVQTATSDIHCKLVRFLALCTVLPEKITW